MSAVQNHESERLKDVERYHRCGAFNGEKLNRLVQLAAKTFGFELVAISTHYRDTQVCHIRLGSIAEELPRPETICLIPVNTGKTVVVPDLTKDSRFASLPSVTGNPNLRFYAGAPLVAPSGRCVGALCLLDTKPRQFSDKDAELLTDLASLAIEHMELVRINDEAKYDSLTGLRNRDYLIQEIQTSLDAGRDSAVVMIDLDGFKEVNDSLGHISGDEALIEAAGRLTGFFDSGRIVARLGGDEFVIFMDHSSDPLAASKLAQDVVKRLAEAMTIGGHLVHLGASVGVAVRSTELKAEQFLGNADLAMYRAKQDGRNCYRLFTRQLRNIAIDRGNIILEMQEAWEDGSFELYYQPIVRLRDNSWIGAEALLRWNYPYRGIVLPSVFLPVLEKSPLAVDVGTWVIDESCRRAALWRKRFDPEFKIAVNLFELQFKSGGLVTRVRESLTRHDLPPHALQLELTERIILADDNRIVEQVRELRDIGVGIAFDDFGTGFASLSALRRYPVSCIKIDRSFISDAATSSVDLSIVTSLIDLAKSLKLDTVAEGIETPEQRAMVARENSVYGQGYLFSRPLPAGQLEDVWPAAATAELPLRMA